MLQARACTRHRTRPFIKWSAHLLAHLHGCRLCRLEHHPELSQVLLSLAAGQAGRKAKRTEHTLSKGMEDGVQHPVGTSPGQQHSKASTAQHRWKTKQASRRSDSQPQLCVVLVRLQHAGLRRAQLLPQCHHRRLALMQRLPRRRCLGAGRLWQGEEGQMAGIDLYPAEVSTAL